jgi:hypothetical protein
MRSSSTAPDLNEIADQQIVRSPSSSRVRAQVVQVRQVRRRRHCSRGNVKAAWTRLQRPDAESLAIPTSIERQLPAKTEAQAGVFASCKSMLQWSPFPSEIRDFLRRYQF